MLAWEVLEVFRTAEEQDFFAGTRGLAAKDFKDIACLRCSGLLVALSVGLRHVVHPGIEIFM